MVAVHRWRRAPVPPVLTKCSMVTAGFTAPLALFMVFGEGGQIAWLPRPSRRILVHTMLDMASGGLGLAVVVALAASAVVVVTGHCARSRDLVVVWALVAGFLVPAPLLWTAGMATLLTLALGFAGTWRALGAKAAPYLRTE